LWDAHTGKQIRILAGHSGGVIALAFSPDGKTLATGSGDKTISLWDVATGRELAVLRGHNSEVTALAFGPDGTWLASADGMVAGNAERDPLAKYVDTTTLPSEIKLWDVKSRKLMRTLTGHTASILSLAISPDGRRLVSGSVDATVKVWDVASGILETNLTGFEGQIMAVAISPDGQSLAVGLYPFYKKGELQMFNLKNYSVRMHFKGQIGPVFTLAFSPDGRTLASGGLDQIVRFWDSATGDELRTIKGHRGSIWSLAWNPAGDRIASASWDQTVKVWDAVQPQGLDLSTGTEFYTSCFSPDGKFLVRGNHHLLVFESGTSKPPFTIPDYQSDNLVVAISPDGSILASGGTDQKVTLWEMGTWRRLTSIEGYQNQIWNLTFSPDGSLLASSDAKSVHLWDVKKGRELNVLHFQTDDRVGSIFFTPDGRTLITSVSGTITFFDVRTGLEQKHNTTGFYYLAQSHDGNSIAALAGSELVLLDQRTMQEKWHASAQGKLVWSANFSPDDKTLATASWDGTARLWSVAGGQEMFAHSVPGVAWNAVFSPDGKWLSVGGGSPRYGEMALLRTATRAEVESAEPPPIIVVQPASQIATAGGAAILNVSAAGENPFTYEWLKDGIFLAGQMNAALKLDNLSLSDAGNYTVRVTDRHGRSVTSSNACLNVLPVHSESFGEIDFIAKNPRSYQCWTGSEHPVAWKSVCAVQPGTGVHGAPALVLTADGSGFLTNLTQAWTEMGMSVPLIVTNPAVFDTTNLNLYKLEATIKTTGLMEVHSHGRVTFQFLTDTNPVLAVSMAETFSTNYQVYAFALGNAEIDAYSGGSWDEFVANLAHINGVCCLVSADDWLKEYDVRKQSSIYLAHVRFDRLIPAASGLRRSFQ
jgi:WD40 repeat protein